MKKFKMIVYKNIMFEIPLSFTNPPTSINVNYT